jgi:hypothetical protein
MRVQCEKELGSKPADPSKSCKSCHILRKRFQNLSYLDNEFLEIARKTCGILKNLYFANLALAKFGSFLLWMIVNPP